MSVEHIFDSGKTEAVDLALSADDEASFMAGSFSAYVIKSHESDSSVRTPRKTFRFSTTISSIIHVRTKKTIR
ncbi:MAG: hypothetical protein IJ171_08375 [Ruminococcus sp.]|nr:hypothetical protein [Ruminococcus sp.]